MTRLLALASILTLAVFALACESSEQLTSNDIVDQIPWDVPETTRYRVLDDGKEEVGTLEMTIEAQGDDALKLRQYFNFPEKGFINDAIVIVDAETLEPQNASFDLDGPDGRLTCDAAYAEADVTAHRVGEDGERTDTIDVPVFAYDSWADLFTWRTIAFGPGFEIRYTDILSCTLDRTQRLGMRLEITDEEEITVPAGVYDTWKMEIHSGGQTQRAWFTRDERHILVKYYNGRETFELTEEP